MTIKAPDIVVSGALIIAVRARRSPMVRCLFHLSPAEEDLFDFCLFAGDGQRCAGLHIL